MLVEWVQLPDLDKSVYMCVIQRRTNDILYIKISDPLYSIWIQQRINSKITYRSKELKIYPKLPHNFKKIHRFRTDFMLANRGANVSFSTNAA